MLEALGRKNDAISDLREATRLVDYKWERDSLNERIAELEGRPIEKADPQSQDIKTIIEALKDKDTRSEAVRELSRPSRKSDPEIREAVPYLIELLNDKDAGQLIQADAVRLLGTIGASANDAIPVLINAMKDLKSSLVRERAGEALGSIGISDSHVVKALIDAMSDPDISPYSYDHYAAKALAQFSPKPEVIEALLKALRHRKALVRQRSATALGIIGPEAQQSIPALIKILKDRDMHVVICGLVALRKMGPHARPAIPLLIDIVRKDRPKRSIAARVLGEIGKEANQAVPALMEALKEESLEEYSFSKEAQGSIAYALARISSDRQVIATVVERLEKLGLDPSDTLMNWTGQGHEEIKHLVENLRTPPDDRSNNVG